MTKIPVNPVLLCAFTVLLVVSSGPLLAAPGDVESSWAAPCKYPSGLASADGHLYLADWREAKIYELSPPDGTVTRTWDAPTLKPAGLTCAEGKLYVSDDHTGRIYTVNLDTGVVDNTFDAPSSSASGLAYADGILYILAKRKIYRVLPDDGTILGYYDVPNRTCRHLTHDGKYLWVSDRIKDELYMVEPLSGTVIGILSAPGPYAAGIAWLDGNLWNVDFQTRQVYRLSIRGEQKYSLSDTRQARVEYLWALSNYGPQDVTDVVLNVAIPPELPNQKLLSEVQYSVTPTGMDADRWGQRCALFELGDVDAGGKAVLTYNVQAEVSAIRYLIIPEDVGTLADIPADIREKYTVDGSRYRIDSPYIRETVKKAVGDEQNPYWIARKIYDFIIAHVKYEMIGGWDVPEVVLKRGSGSCSEYTYTFVALCRAAGLPARYQGSVVVRGDDASIDDAFHRWAQIYLPNYGWVPVDASGGDGATPADQGRAFGGLSNRFLITTQGGGDSEYLGWSYNSFGRYKSTGYCKVEEDTLAFWEPLEAGGEASASGSRGRWMECRGKPSQ